MGSLLLTYRLRFFFFLFVFIGTEWFGEFGHFRRCSWFIKTTRFVHFSFDWKQIYIYIENVIIFLKVCFCLTHNDLTFINHTHHIQYYFIVKLFNPKYLHIGPISQLKSRPGSRLFKTLKPSLALYSFNEIYHINPLNLWTKNTLCHTFENAICNHTTTRGNFD